MAGRQICCVHHHRGGRSTTAYASPTEHGGRARPGAARLNQNVEQFAQCLYRPR
jgi:hypothetical protein